MKFYIVHPVENPSCPQIAEFPPIVMTLAGADPSGGAGIQADILTLASLGCHPCPVITAVTVQDTRSVENFWVMDAEQKCLIRARFLLEDMPVSVFKVGMIGSVENAAVIAEIAPTTRTCADSRPVLASGGGDELACAKNCAKPSAICCCR